MRAGFVGLGAMGAPMAARLAGAGQLATVWNRTPIRAEQFAAQFGIPVAESLSVLAAEVVAIFICVSADRDVLEVLDTLAPDLRPGQVIVDFSTVAVETAQVAANRINAVGADFLDSPVTGGVEGARAGSLAMMVGGNPQTLARVHPLMKSMAERIVHMGPVGTGQAAKAVNQVMVAGINQAVTEALAFGQRLGLDMQKTIDVISGGAAGNWFLTKRGLTMTQGCFNPGFKIALHRKDLAICHEMAEKTGVALPSVEQTLVDYDRLLELGFGDEDISALFRLRRPQ